MPNNKNQHFVPQFYLRGFSRDQKSISVYNIRSKQVIRNAPIRTQCSRDYYYSDLPIVDKMLTGIENDVSTIIRSISSFQRVRPIEAQIFLLYIATQLRRTDAAINETLKVDDAIRNEMARDPSFARMGAEEILGVNLSPSMHAIASFMMMPFLMDLSHITINNNTDVEFVTSDNPVVIFNKAGSQGRIGNEFGLGNSGVALYLPLSPRVGYLLYDSNYYMVRQSPPGRIDLKNRSDAIRLNEIHMRNSMWNIYARSFSTSCMSSIQSATTRRNDTGVEIIVGLGEWGYRVRQIHEHMSFPTFLSYRLRPTTQTTLAADTLVRDSAWVQVVQDYLNEVWPTTPFLSNILPFSECHPLWDAIGRWKWNWYKEYF